MLLRDAGLSLKAISATSLLFLPWALKFLWAPFVDHWGTRRQWLLPLQVAAVVGRAAADPGRPRAGYVVVLAAAFLFNLVAACQDVATDGLAVRILDSASAGSPTASRSAPTAIGMILGGGLLLWIFARTDWATMFACMAALLALTILPVLPLREPPRPERGRGPRPQRWRSAGSSGCACRAWPRSSRSSAATSSATRWWRRWSGRSCATRGCPRRRSR